MCGGKGGGGGKPQVAGTQVVEQRTEFPEEIRPFIQDILEKSQARFNEQSGKPMPTFPGGTKARIAEMDPLQEETLTEYDIASRSGLAGSGTNLGSALPYYQAGLSALQDSQQAFGPQQAAQYMNPYQQAVVDVAKREAIRQTQPTYQAIGDRAVSTGGFGGSRQAIAESELNRNLQQQLSDLQTRGSQQAFEQGRTAFEQQKARDAGASSRYFAQAPQAYRQQLAELSAREGVGKTRRAEDQRNRNLLYEQFKEEQMYPSRNLAEYQSIVRGFPYQPQMYETKQNLAPAPGLGQQLMGGLGTAASIYGGMGGFSKGGFGSFGQAGGQVGGLASLASGGQIQGGGFETHQNNIYGSVTEVLDKIVTNPKYEEFLRTTGKMTPELEEQVKKHKVKMAETAGETIIDEQYVGKTGPSVSQPGLEEGQSTVTGLESLGLIKPKPAPAPKPTSKPTVQSGALNEGQIVTGGRGDPILKGGSGTDLLNIKVGDVDVTSALEQNLKTLTQGKSYLDDAKNIRGKLNTLSNTIGDTETRIADIKTGIDDAYSPMEAFQTQFATDLTAFTKSETDANKAFKKARESAINKRAATKLTNLETLGKEAKKTGERDVMQNLFLNMLLPMSLQAGRDPQGFIAGALKGGQDNMTAFVDRYTSIKDKYSTGKEKRARDKMAIGDKQQSDIFSMQDTFENRRKDIDKEMFNLSNNNNKLIAQTGVSKQTEINNADLKKLSMEKDAMNTVIQGLELEKNIAQEEQTLAGNSIKAIATLLDTLGLDSKGTTLKNKSSAEQEKIMLSAIENKYKFVVDKQTGSMFIDGKAIDKNDPGFKDMIQELNIASTQFNNILKAAGNTSYPQQIKARLAVLSRGGAGIKSKPIDVSQMNQTQLNAIPSGSYIIRNGRTSRKK